MNPRTFQSGPQLEWKDLRSLQQYAAVSDRTLREWIHLPVNPLPAVQVDQGKLFVKRTDFDRWLAAHRYQPVNSIDLDRITSEIVNEFQKAA